MDDDVIWLRIEDVKLASSPRLSGVDSSHVALLAEQGGEWPPILVSRNDHAVIDGLHRLAAARLVGVCRIAAVIFDGTPEEEFAEAVRRNVVHGLPLSVEERKAAARRLLREHPEWSNRRIASICALAHRTVDKARTGSQGLCGSSENRLGRDGRSRPVNPAANRTRIVELLRANPEASLRVIARVVGTSPETVRRVRRNLDAAKGDGAKGSDVDRPLELVRPGGRAQWAVRSLQPPVGDPALLATPEGTRFAAWFESKCIGEDWHGHVFSVPLSRVYEVADEARRRSSRWADFAAAVEQRAHTSATG